MNILYGKKVLCFIALPHHNRILMPIMQALQAQGAEVEYITAAAEGAFEITLNEADLPYRHALDYCTPAVQEQIATAFQTFRPAWQDKLLSQPLMQAVPVVIQDKSVRLAMENLFCFQRMFEVEKPDLLFALHELNPWGKILGYLSQVHRIPYITFQEGLYYTSIYTLRFHTDYTTACVAWGEATRRKLAAAGCAPDKIFPLGNIGLWKAGQQATQTAAMAATRTALGIKPEKKIVLFLMSHAEYNTFEPAVFCEWLKTHEDVVLVFKWHPISKRKAIEQILKDVRGFPGIISVQDFDTAALLGASDVCIVVGNSTTALEALVVGKPLIEILLGGECYSLAAEGVAEAAQGFEDAGEIIERILTSGLSLERQENVARYLADHLAFQDDGTATRVVDMAAEMLTARANSAAAPLLSVQEERFPCSLILPVDDAPLEHVLTTLNGIAAHVPAELFEIIIVNAASLNEQDGQDEIDAIDEVNQLLAGLEGDVKVIAGKPEWGFGVCCNRAVAEARGKYLAFLKPGLIPCEGWLEGLLSTAEQEPDVGVVGGRVANENDLLWHIGVAFDHNQSPFSLYRLLPLDFIGARRQRQFEAVEAPFVVSREQFCRLGGFSSDLTNRFEDIDFCLRLRANGARVLYTPHSTILRTAASWQPTPDQDTLNRVRFYARWTGSLWQNDAGYLKEDGLDHDRLSGLYRDLAGRVASGARTAQDQMDQMDQTSA